MKVVNSLPSREYLIKCFTYSNGKIFWLERPNEHFVDTWRSNIFKSRNTGKEAGWISPQGYRRVKLDNLDYNVHHIIWKLVYGYDATELDHINGDRSDNNLENLREVTRQQNCMNKSTSSNNSSGVTGVSYHNKKNYWVAYITIDGVRVNLGQFKEKHRAVKARQAAELKYFKEFRRINCAQ